MIKFRIIFLYELLQEHNIVDLLHYFFSISELLWESLLHRKKIQYKKFISMVHQIIAIDKVLNSIPLSSFRGTKGKLSLIWIICAVRAWPPCRPRDVPSPALGLTSCSQHRPDGPRACTAESVFPFTYTCWACLYIDLGCTSFGLWRGGKTVQ